MVALATAPPHAWVENYPTLRGKPADQTVLLADRLVFDVMKGAAHWIKRTGERFAVVLSANFATVWLL